MKPREDGWRLPTLDELNIIYQHKHIIDNLGLEAWYWSSTPINDFNARCQRLRDGNQSNGYRDIGLSVRLVRSIVNEAK